MISISLKHTDEWTQVEAVSSNLLPWEVQIHRPMKKRKGQVMNEASLQFSYSLEMCPYQMQKKQFLHDPSLLLSNNVTLS